MPTCSIRRATTETCVDILLDCRRVLREYGIERPEQVQVRR